MIKLKKRGENWIVSLDGKRVGMIRPVNENGGLAYFAKTSIKGKEVRGETFYSLGEVVKSLE